MYFLDLDKKKADILITELEKDGYIEKGNKFYDEQLWRNSIKGNALALASAAKPILRTTAEKRSMNFWKELKK